MEGVKGFYYKLDKMASRMVDRPSDYAFRLRLFEGLPTWIYDTLLERNILPEFCNLEDIRENARQIEEVRLRAHTTFKGSTVNTTSQRQTQQSGNNKGSTNNQSNPRSISQNKSTRSNINRSNGERS